MELYSNLLPFLFEGVYVVDKNRKIIFWNKSAELITGYKSEEVVNKNCYQNILRHVTVDGKALCFNGCPLHATLGNGETNSGSVFLHHKDGHRIPVEVKTFPIVDDDGSINAAIEVFTDQREKDDAFRENRRLKKLLTMDELTKVHNRRYLDFQLKSMAAEANEYNTTFGVLFFDIDHFKNVNDTYGHLVGDEILKLVARTLRSNIRGEDVIGRWGGEEFIALVYTNNEKELKFLAEKLRILIAKSIYSHEGENLSVTVSIGGSLFINNEPVEDLVERADKNMYQSKEAGRNRSTT